MKVINIIIIVGVLLSILPKLTFAQGQNIQGTYLYSTEEEYMQIDNDIFQIIRTAICRPCIDLNDGDSIAARGKIEYITNDFIKLKSDRDSVIYNSTNIVESLDKNLKDSVKIRFVFPFKGKFRIDASLGDLPFKSTENNSIIIPKKKNTLDNLDFDIYDLNLKYNGRNGECLGRIVFFDFPWYEFKNKRTNSVLITIPEFTNSYFARYVIDGEYAKTEKDKIIWRNRVYIKISDELIIPKIDIGDRAIDDPNGVDWVDELKNKK